MTCHRRTLSGQRDLLALAAAFPERYCGLLQSVVHDTAQARYDILFVAVDDSLRLEPDGQLRDGTGQALPGRFLDALDARWQSLRTPRDEHDELPFHGGWLLFLSYELAGRSSRGWRSPSPARCRLRWLCAVLRR